MERAINLFEKVAKTLPKQANFGQNKWKSKQKQGCL
jgi:hypothetical protein